MSVSKALVLPLAVSVVNRRCELLAERIVVAAVCAVLAGCAQTPEQQYRIDRALESIQRARQPQPVGAQGTAFYVREYSQGFNKICYYNRLGSPVAITISSTQLCPMQLP